VTAARRRRARTRTGTTLRTRLILAAVYLLVTVVVALEIPLAVNVAGRARSELDSRLVGIASTVAARINDDVPDPVEPFVIPEVPPVIGQIAAETAEATRSRIVIVDRLGRILADSSGQALVGTQYMTPARPEFNSAINGGPDQGGRIDIQTRASETVGDELLLVTVPIVHFQRAIGAVRISDPLSDVNSRVRNTVLRFAVIGLAVVLVGLALAWILAAGLTRPVHRLAEAASRVGQGDLEARATVEGPAEIRTLGESFNRMADALSANLTAQRDFLANASHQLRTPLTGLRLRLEAIEHQGGVTGEQAAKAQAEVSRLNRLVQDLLELARASSGGSSGGLVDLVAVAREAVDRWDGPATEAGKQLVERLAGPATVWANPDDLGHLVDNLIENSIRYTPEGTEIVVETRSSATTRTLAVCDNGPGVPEAERDRIFERFFRGDVGKRAGPGTGLGLAVVAELVRRWGGRLWLRPEPGTSIEAEFPAPPTIP
jgi:two-component system, OmpR family, sensor kinase